MVQSFLYENDMLKAYDFVVKYEHVPREGRCALLGHKPHLIYFSFNFRVI